jgi:Protein of unknown function (DUF2924)
MVFSIKTFATRSAGSMLRKWPDRCLHLPTPEDLDSRPGLSLSVDVPLHRDRAAIRITLPRTKPKAAPSPAGPASGSKTAAAAMGPASSSPGGRSQHSGSLGPGADQLGDPGQRAPLSDRRLPPPGTRLVRTAGGKRCECIVEREGVRYAGRLYRSLSGAAAAAARDQGLSPTQNGFVFWLGSLSRRSEMEALELRWEGYRAALRRLLLASGAEQTRKLARHLEIASAELLATRINSASA